MRPSPIPLLAAALLAVLVSLAVVPPARCAAPADVEVAVVLASNGAAAVDPELSAWAPKLKQMFSFTTYRLLDRQKKAVGDGATDFPLPGGRTLKASQAPSKDGKVRLSVQVLDGAKNLLSTTLAMNRGGTVLLGGPSHQDGKLILILTAP